MSDFTDALNEIESPVIRVTLAFLNLGMQIAKVVIIMHFVIKFW